MRKFSAALLALFLAGATTRAEWRIVSSASDYSLDRIVEHRHLELRSASGDEATIELALFSTQTATLRVLDDAPANDSLGEIMPRAGAIAGTNGGYFDPEYAPVGLLVSDGHLVAP
ncbi:MAG: phosphodiester glycosidase family protein, partial [Verrucomicrobiota bacterium]|nr:phosphodiester glycosidase family protein [Verrucomicrobiota bacterium]